MTEKLKRLLVICVGVTGAWLPTVRKSAGVRLVGVVDINREIACAGNLHFAAMVVGAIESSAKKGARPDWRLSREEAA